MSTHWEVTRVIAGLGMRAGDVRCVRGSVPLIRLDAEHTDDVKSVIVRGSSMVGWRIRAYSPVRPTPHGVNVMMDITASSVSIEWRIVETIRALMAGKQLTYMS